MCTYIEPHQCLVQRNNHFPLSTCWGLANAIWYVVSKGTFPGLCLTCHPAGSLGWKSCYLAHWSPAGPDTHGCSILSARLHISLLGNSSRFSWLTSLWLVVIPSHKAGAPQILSSLSLGVHSIPFFRSSVNILNNVNSSIIPQGVPLLTRHQLDFKLLNNTLQP